MNRILALSAAAAAILLCPAPAAAAGLPPGFLGISPQNADERDYDLMERLGVRSIRLPLYWSGVERHSPYLSPSDWSGFDAAVALGARHRMRVLPFVWGSPRWIAPEAHMEPGRSAAGLRAWASFLHRAARRYGPGGAFWRQNPDLPRLPVRAWELWNEPNIVSFSHRSNPARFARLLRVGGRAIHRARPGSKVILGGLFGRPLQVPPNVYAGDFLDRVYRSGRIKRHFDGVALHPYVADAAAIRPQVRRLRRVMRRNRDAAARIYVTELGWGSDRNESRWERGPRGQARELNQAIAMLARNRHRWRIGGVWWFSWTDLDGGCQFCDSSGLLTQAREAKPAWYRFARWIGGDPSLVPRAPLG